MRPTSTTSPGCMAARSASGSSAAASSSAQRSNLTGGLRSRSGPARDGPLDRCKGVDLLDGLGPDARNFLELLYGLEFSVGLPVIDDALGGRRSDFGQFVELFHVSRVYVYLERVLRFILYLLQGSGVHDPWGPLRKSCGVEGSTDQHSHYERRDEYVRPVPCQDARRRLAPHTRAARCRVEEFVSHNRGYRDILKEDLMWAREGQRLTERWVEPRGIEPLTSALPARRSPS